MKHMCKILTTIILGLVLANNSHSQNTDCKVLKETINDNYQGECKDGLAHGQGIAIGEHVYKGNFKKGLPSGHGKYVWENRKKIYEGEWKNGKRNGKGKLIIKTSGKDSVVTGIWKEGNFLKKRDQKPYEVIEKQSVENVRIHKNGTENKIVIKLTRHGGNKEIKDLRLNTSSGSKNVDNLYKSSIVYKYPEFPFKGEINYKAPNKFDSYMKRCKVSFRINKPGRWVVKIVY